ncbi:MAG: AAA family ATPase [Desulfotomaculaceae bacterium]|nr:AAA family ATPase [Desulfotomaculaceae bacterium]
MNTKVCIKKMTFSDNITLELEPNEIIVFVGPNNAGKSASLKEINEIMRNLIHQGKVIKRIECFIQGTEEELITDLQKISKIVTDTNPLPTYRGFGFQIYERNAKMFWANLNTSGLRDLTPVFINLLNTEARLNAANPPPNISLTKDPPTHPIHYLQINDTIEEQFSNYFKQAFGLDLIVHRNAGNQVPLYIGDKPIPGPGEDRVSISYLKKIEELDLLHEQGDGMRSFVGVLLNSFISHHSVLLIDEPEAFLHPPQARLLGKMLARDLPSERQLFLATHSGDFLRGLLDANIRNLRILRIQRDNQINRVSELNKDDISHLWSDPLLRYSNILDGLFHSKVIICESDSDCKFYSAIMDSLTDGSGQIAPDILFTHCGGKHRIPSIVQALVKINVPVAVVCDFDILNDEKPLRDIVEKLNGNWSNIKEDWRLVKRQIESKRPELDTNEVKKQILDILESIEDKNFPKEAALAISKVLKKTSAWSQAKETGKGFIPSGEATQAFSHVNAYLKSIKLFVVEIGELESFARSIGNHGPKWVNEVLQKDIKNDPELEEARRFVSEIIS